jgi:hypothetical protein
MPRRPDPVVVAKYPRVRCPVCDQPVAGIPTTGIGIVSVHDHKQEPRSLVLCPGSMQHVQAVDAAYVQEVFEEEGVEVEPGTVTLF